MICKRPTNSLFINSNGGLRPDPRYDSDIDYIDNYLSLEEYLKSDKIKNVQNNIVTDINCYDCIKTSSQSSFNSMDDKNTELTTLFLGVSNNCNFECRMCGSFASHKLIERDKILENNNFYLQYPIDLKRKYLTEEQLEKLFCNIDVFSSINTIKINGGEPFIEDSNFYILEKLLPFSENINVSILTNASVFPNKERVNLLKKFKSVKIGIGLECIENMYEYIRQNSNWQQTKNNIKNFEETFDVRFFVSLTAMSIFDMQNLIDFMGDRDYDLQTITRPDYMSHTIFGNSLKDIYPKTLQKYVPNIPQNQKSISKFFSYINILDKMYKTSIFDVQPKFKRFI